MGISSFRYITLLVLGGTLIGCCFFSFTVNLVLNRKKSMSSVAASIFVWIIVLFCEVGGSGSAVVDVFLVSFFLILDFAFIVILCVGCWRFVLGDDYAFSLGVFGLRLGGLRIVNIFLDCLFFLMVI